MYICYWATTLTPEGGQTGEDMDHPLEGFRRKEPLSKLMDESYAALDHVLGYVTLRMDDEGVKVHLIEEEILIVFGKLQKIKEMVKDLVPADDF